MTFVIKSKYHLTRTRLLVIRIMGFKMLVLGYYVLFYNYSFWGIRVKITVIMVYVKIKRPLHIKLSNKLRLINN